MPTPGNGTAAIIDCCQACRDAADNWLAQLRTSPEVLVPMASTLRCVAFFSVIADTLKAGEDCPTGFIDGAVEMARDLPEDSAGCADACRAAADAMSAWLDGGYERLT